MESEPVIVDYLLVHSINRREILTEIER